MRQILGRLRVLRMPFFSLGRESPRRVKHAAASRLRGGEEADIKLDRIWKRDTYYRRAIKNGKSPASWRVPAGGGAFIWPFSGCNRNFLASCAARVPAPFNCRIQNWRVLNRCGGARFGSYPTLTIAALLGAGPRVHR